MSAVIYIVDRYGRKRRARPGEVLADRESVNFSPLFMDAAAVAVLAQKYGRHAGGDQPRGYVRGYQHFDAMPPCNVQDDPAAAYEERNARLQNAWRKNCEQDAADDHASQRALDVPQARLIADAAYEDRKVRLANAWRNNQ